MMRKWLKEIRERYELSIKEMADKLELDVDYYEIIENGNLPLNIPVLVAAKIAEDFDIPLSRLIIYEEEYRDNQQENRAINQS